MKFRAPRKAYWSAASLLACLSILPCVIAQKPQSEAQLMSTRTVLNPPIRGRKVRLRFSPDGRYLLLQSESGLFLFATQPLKPVLHIDANYLYPTRFSRDSQTLVGVSYALRTARWRVPGGETVSTGELQTSDGCISGEVSSDGELFVCHGVDLDVQVIDLKTRHEVFRDASRQWLPQSVAVPLALPRNNIYATALGLVSVRSLQVFANEGAYPDTLAFSPDGTIVGISGPREIAFWNLSSKRRVNAPSALAKYPGAGICFLDATRVLVSGVPQHAEIVSLGTGKVAGKLDFDVSDAALTSNPRYLAFAGSEDVSRRLYDLQEERLLAVPENLALDLREDVLAVVDPKGELRLFHLGEQAPFASTPVPLEGTPKRFSVATSPNLELLALGFGGETGLYKVETGQRILSPGHSSQISLPDSRFAYFFRPAEGGESIDVRQADASSASVSTVWTAETTFLRAMPSVALDYEVQGPKQNVPAVLPDGKIPFQLTARRWSTGDLLWEKRFITSHPVPFVDSQGKNLVLAWEADTEAARSAAKRCPQAWPLFQKTRPSRSDTFFEVLDSATGATLGGVLLRTGSGPLSFDSVAAVGSILIVAKAEGRVTLYSLDDGEVKAHLNGSLPAANDKAQLLALVGNDNQLGIYDLRSGKKLTTEHLGQSITYAHFSEDGRRLLVLTRQQTVCVLDVRDAAKTAN